MVLSNSVSIQRVCTVNGAPPTGANASSDTTARWKVRAVAIPSTSNSASARRDRSIACSRVAPVTISLASKESNAPPTHPALLDTAVQSDSGAGRRGPPRERARRWQEPATRVLAVDAELDGVAAQLRVVVAERLAVGDAEHLTHQVDPADLLRHRVLHLEAGVDLQEGDGAVGADQELAGAGADVARLLHDRLGGSVDLGGLRLAEERRRRLLDELLVPTLQRAVARGDDDHVPELVRQALGLDVSRVVQVALDEALAAPEGGHGLADGGVVELGDLLEGACDLQAATASAVGSLDRDRQAVLLSEGHDLVGASDRLSRARHQGRLGPERDVARLDLVPEAVDRRRRGADPDEPRVQDGLGERRVLGEEAVSGVHGVSTGPGRHVEDLGDVEVRRRGGVAPQGVRLVGASHVQRVTVGVGVDGDAGQAGVTAGAHDAYGDLAAVGDQDLLHDASCPLPRPGHASVPSPCSLSGGQDPAAQRSATEIPTSDSNLRRPGRDRPTTVDGSPSTPSTNQPPSPSMVKAPATRSGSPLAT